MTSWNKFRLISGACVAYIFGCSFLGLVLGDWTYFESFYFTIVTFTTVGLGDIVPEVNYTDGYAKVGGKYAALAVLCLLGLALLAAFLTGLEQYLTSMTVLPLKLGNSFRNVRGKKKRGKAAVLSDDRVSSSGRRTSVEMVTNPYLKNMQGSQSTLEILRSKRELRENTKQSSSRINGL